MPTPGSDAAAAKPPVPVDLGAIDPEAREAVESCLRMARERLGMDIAWLAEFSEGRELFRVVEGDREDWDLWDDSWMPETESFCLRMLEGEIPNAIPDASQEPAVGAYIGVPLVLPSGEVRGTLCCARHTPDHELSERDVRFLQVIARMVADELAFRETQRELRRVERRSSAIDALLAAVELRDRYTGEHSQTVVRLATAVGRRLGLGDDALMDLEQVALLHDVGKVGMPDAILLKPGPLTEEEWVTMRRHPVLGAEIVGNQPDLAHLAPAVRAEHEHWNGRGYPDGLAGDRIPLESRVVLVSDGFHAMVSDRPYRRALPVEAAVEELQRCSGAMFWPEAVEALVAGL
jgi:hypothetical protein